MLQNYDPFDTRPAEDIFEVARNRAAAEAMAEEAKADLDFFGGVKDVSHSALSTPTQEGGSVASARPAGFDEEFHVDVSVH